MKFLIFTLVIGFVSSSKVSGPGHKFVAPTYRDLVSAANSARPGDSIYLLQDTTYHINLDLTRSGLPHAPITLIGERGSKITGSRTAIVLKGSFWKLQNLEFENISDAILVKGSNNTLKSLSFHNVDEQAIFLKGSGNLVKNCVFNGVSNAILVQGRENTLLKNSITASLSTIKTTPRSCCGLVSRNVLNGLMTIEGSDFELVQNTANSDVSIRGKQNTLDGNRINGRLQVVGCGNNFYGNTAGSSDFTGTCYNWDDGKNNFGPPAHLSNHHDHDNDYHRP
ncbi:unnamed protein product [Orchesella dallaii]|uniref:Right handed beta helix domain-containing protein n=1 Tax=Orchesella dallaii TaxID=48710 RepID=A0ABP1PYB2_9HEXA